MKLAKPLWKISIATTVEAEDAIAEMLGGIFNRSACSSFDTRTSVSRVFIFREKKIPRADGRKIREGLKQIQHCGLKVGSGKISISKVRQQDWTESWKRHFKPIEIGNPLLIKPSWSKRRPRKNQAVIVLDPGLSFGTGRHPTTEFCLCEIVRRRKFENQQSFLDIGAGSGILAIAAAKLGYEPVHAIDFDPAAVRIAKANAKTNGVSRKIKVVRGDVTKLSAKPRQQFDLVCANLISNLLIAERKKIVAQLNRGGTLILAGILKSEFLEVQKAFENLGLELISRRIGNEWRSGSFCLR